MKNRQKRPLRLLCIPVAVTAVAVCGLLFQNRIIALLGMQADKFSWAPLVFCALLVACVLLVMAYLLYLNSINRRVVEQERENLRRSEELYRIFEDFSDAVVFEADPNADTIRFNPKFNDMFGHPPLSDSLENSIQTLERLTSAEDHPALQAYMDAYRNRTLASVAEIRLTINGTSGIWHRLEYRLLLDSAGGIYRLVGKLTNIDREKRSLQSLRTKAESDSLTGLLNHEATKNNIDRILNTEGYGGNHALLVIDIDDFKRVNDDFGHPEGDRMLLKLSETIRTQFRASDVVGRIGGDEFIVFVSHTATESLMRAKAEELSEQMQYLCVSGKMERMVTCSIGIALTRGRPMSFDSLFREADAALYHTKSIGKNGFVIFAEGEASENAVQQEPIEPQGTSANFQLRALLEYMEGGVLLYEIGEEIRVIYMSPSYHKMVHRQERQNEGTASKPYQYVYAADEDRLEQEMRRGVESGGVVDTVYRVRTEGGDILWRHMRAVRVPHQESDYPVLIAVVTDVTALKEQEKKLLDNEQLLKLALEQTELRIWTYDIKANELTGPKLNCVYRNLPECNIESGLTHPGSTEEYRAFYRRIQAGEPFGSCVIRQCLFGPQYEWLRLSFRNLFDENGLAYQAIGVTEPLPGVEMARERLEQQERFLASVSDALMMTIRYNLSRDRLESYWLAAPDQWPEVDALSPHSIFDAFYERALSAQDKRLVLTHMSTAEQLRMYENGEEIDTVELRMTYGDGRIRWVACQNGFFTEPVTGDRYVIGLIRDVDRRKRWELALPLRVERDAATGLLTRRATETMVRHVLRTEKRQGITCAMLLIAVDPTDATQEPGFVGSRMQERLMTEIGRRLCVVFDGENVVGRQDSNGLLLFAPDIGGEKQAMQLSARIEDMMDVPFLHSIHQGRLICRVGLAVGRTDRHTYEMLLSMSEAALADVRKGASGGVLPAEALTGLKRTDSVGMEWSEKNDAETTKLNAEAEHALLTCAAAILQAEQPEDAIPEMLAALAAYFSAERVLLLAYCEEDDSVDAVSEWILPEHERAFDNMQQVKVSDLPLAERARTTRASVQMYVQEHKSNGLCVPMEKDGSLAGFIYIENASRGLEAAGVVESVAAFLMTRVLRRDRRLSAAVHIDELTQLQDYEGYRQYIEQIDPDTLSSFGVLCLDVNGLSALNRDYGKLYGDKLLQFIARTVGAVFPEQSAFRISGDEFILLASNLTREAFLQRVTEVSRRCETAFVGAVCMGHTWTDDQMNLMKQVENAQDQMQMAKQPYYRRMEKEGERTKPQRLDQLEGFIQNGQFLLYLQPQVSVATGECVGAEALVRFYDPEQDLIVTPDMFVPTLERENIIQLLDLHVFELALSLMQRWKEEGRPLKPLSVNFSRTTALDTNTSVRLREIQRRFDILPSMIEIELTERIGYLERATVAEACKPFTDMGYKLVLDDFGSEYSSLSILSLIPFGKLKLDRSITAGLSDSRMGSLIVENSVRLCRETGIDCVAEGVETADQLKKLVLLGCTHAQGYYFDKPMPVELYAEKYCPVTPPEERTE